MIKQARLLVFQAVASATSPMNGPTASKGLSSLSLMEADTSAQQKKRAISQVGDDNARAISPHNISNNTSMRKSASLLKRPGSFAQKNANKSVQWNSSTLNVRERGPKRMRKNILSGPALRRSTKSFGKPGADIFECPRNATFGEFGNIGQNPYLQLRRNTSLRRPSPYGISTHTLQRTAPTSNEQFDLKASTNTVSRDSFVSSSLQSSASSLVNKTKPSFHDLSRSAVYSVAPPARSASLLRSFQKLTNGSITRTPTQLECLLLSTQRRLDNPEMSGNKQNAKF